MANLFMHGVRSKREAIQKEKPEQIEVEDDHCFTGFDGHNYIDVGQGFRLE